MSPLHAAPAQPRFQDTPMLHLLVGLPLNENVGPRTGRGHLSFFPLNTAGDQYKVAIITSRVLKTGAPAQRGRGCARHWDTFWKRLPTAWTGEDGRTLSRGSLPDLG